MATDDQIEPQWQVTVRVPMRLDGELRDELFTAVADAVADWEPADRDDWDADVSGHPVDHSVETALDRAEDRIAAAVALCERIGTGSLVTAWEAVVQIRAALTGETVASDSVTVRFIGGPWGGKTFEMDHVTAPVFAVGHSVGNHYYLNTKGVPGEDMPSYYWDGTEWERWSDPTTGQTTEATDGT